MSETQLDPDQIRGAILGHVVEDEGAPLATRHKLNFVGGGVTATDDAGADTTIVTIPFYGTGDPGTLAVFNSPGADHLVGFRLGAGYMIVGGPGGIPLSRPREVYKVVFTGAGDVALRADGAIVTARV